VSTTSFLPMHVKALGFSRNPFPYTPDAQSYFLTSHVEQQFAELSHCILDRKGFFLLTSDVGLGKSTMVRRLIISMQQQNVRCALVVNTFLQGPELLSAIVNDFGLPASGDLYKDHKILNQFLLEMHQQNATCLVVIDDAQNLSKSSLEMIRLLSNLETDQEKLVQILLVGQQELEVTLASTDLRQLRSRIANHITLKPLSRQETQEYVAFRLQASFDEKRQVLLPQRINTKASEKLWVASKGVPRNMHIILDRCMYGLLTNKELEISVAIMDQAIADTQYLRSKHDFHLGTIMQSAGSADANTGRKSIAKLSLVAVSVSFLIAGFFFWINKPWFMTQNWAFQGSELEIQRFASDNKAKVLGGVSTQAKVEVNNTATSSLQQTSPETQKNLPVQLTVLKSDGVAACSNQAETAVSALSANLPLHRAALSEESWALVGDKLSKHVQACFESTLSTYIISWRAPQATTNLPTGLEVAKYQIALSHSGSLVATEVDGKFGSRTANAIKTFQSSIGIPVTGQFDALTVLVLGTVFDI
jgi:general secretion pathway protein A